MTLLDDNGWFLLFDNYGWEKCLLICGDESTEGTEADEQPWYPTCGCFLLFTGQLR